MYNNHVAIHHWAEDDRPREKLINKGKNSLSDAELMAIILGSGSRNESAVQLSQRILGTAFNNLYNLSKLSLSDLCKFKGMGPAKAVSLMAAMELGHRLKSTLPHEKTKIRSSKDAFLELTNQFTDPHVEEFHILLLNQANELLSKHFVSRGGITGTVADIRVMARLAIEGKATGLIISHNHPSGQLHPSSADIEITQKIKKGLDLLDIKLLDHLILANNSYFSFSDQQMME
jgi:DNA repair protein RadC